jgi:alanyl-tRNA synthetase
MLGNFSFGDSSNAMPSSVLHASEQACCAALCHDCGLRRWAWELATVEFGLAPERVWVSVYEHDAETLAIWRDEMGVPIERIQRLGDKDNFWAAGPTGPCGPCSELYYDFHPERGTENATVEDDSRFIEFYNLVFMENNRSLDGSLAPLANKNIRKRAWDSSAWRKSCSACPTTTRRTSSFPSCSVPQRCVGDAAPAPLLFAPHL